MCTRYWRTSDAVEQSRWSSVNGLLAFGMSRTKTDSVLVHCADCSEVCRNGVLAVVGGGAAAVVLARRTTSTSLFVTRLLMHCGDSAAIAASWPSKPEMATGPPPVVAFQPRFASVASHGFAGNCHDTVTSD